MSAEADGLVQFFAVPASAADHDRQNKAWVWYGATMVDWKLGVFEVSETGLLDFQPNNEAEDSDDSARR